MTTKASPHLSFAKLAQGMPMPNLLDIQTRAFESLLQPDGKGNARADVGLERVFRDLFPIQDVNGTTRSRSGRTRSGRRNTPSKSASSAT